MRITGTPKLSAKLRRQLEAIKKLPDDQIDLTDIPELKEDDWLRPHFVGLHHRPGKKSVTIRLDEDMLRWFKKEGRGWQTKMNWVLRLYFSAHRKPGSKIVER